MKIINTLNILTLKDIKSGEVYIFKQEGLPTTNYCPTYEVSVADEDETYGIFWTEERAKEYAEFIEYKMEQKRICDMNHLLYADKDGICSICGKPLNEDF